MTTPSPLWPAGALDALHTALAPWRDNHCTAGQIDPDELLAELDHHGFCLVASADDSSLRAALTARLLALRDVIGDPDATRLARELTGLLDGAP